LEVLAARPLNSLDPFRNPLVTGKCSDPTFVTPDEVKRVPGKEEPFLPGSAATCPKGLDAPVHRGHRSGEEFVDNASSA
jgi:hypothetical protein